VQDIRVSVRKGCHRARSAVREGKLVAVKAPSPFAPPHRVALRHWDPVGELDVAADSKTMYCQFARGGFLRYHVLRKMRDTRSMGKTETL
jgi:hypothetical protein